MVKRFVAYFYFNGFHFSLGIHFDWNAPNFELHVPCGFFRIGWVETFPGATRIRGIVSGSHRYRAFGWDYE